MIEGLRHLKNCFSPSREDSVFESICDFASLRETHFWGYSEVSVNYSHAEILAS